MSRVSSFITLVSVLCIVTQAGAAQSSDVYCVLDFWVKADGGTDSTAAFQKALNSASEAGGGIVYAPRGNYFFSGHLDLPRSVTLKGVWESVPSHNGFRNPGGATPM